jgi:hypothetical protein
MRGPDRASLKQKKNTNATCTFRNMGAVLRFLERKDSDDFRSCVQAATSNIEDVVREINPQTIANLVQLSVVLSNRNGYDVWRSLSIQFYRTSGIIHGEHHPLSRIFALFGWIDNYSTTGSGRVIRQTIRSHFQSTIQFMHWDFHASQPEWVERATRKFAHL